MVVAAEDEDEVVAVVDLEEEVVEVEDHRGEGVADSVAVVEAGVAFLQGEEDQEEVDLLVVDVDVVDSRYRFFIDSENHAAMDSKNPSSNSIIPQYTCKGRCTTSLCMDILVHVKRVSLW